MMSVLGIALAIVLAIVAARYALGKAPARRRKNALRALLEACHGDQDLAERLVMSEMDRDEHIGFAEAAKRARARLRRDRR